MAVRMLVREARRGGPEGGEDTDDLSRREAFGQLTVHRRPGRGRRLVRGEPGPNTVEVLGQQGDLRLGIAGHCYRRTDVSSRPDTTEDVVAGQPRRRGGSRSSVAVVLGSHDRRRQGPTSDRCFRTCPMRCSQRAGGAERRLSLARWLGWLRLDGHQAGHSRHLFERPPPDLNHADQPGLPRSPAEHAVHPHYLATAQMPRSFVYPFHCPMCTWTVRLNAQQYAELSAVIVEQECLDSCAQPSSSVRPPCFGDRPGGLPIARSSGLVVRRG
jgi:hypothetical protein